MSILASLKLLKKLDQTNTYTAYYPSKEFSENTLVESLAKKWNFKNYSVKISPEDVHNNLNEILAAKRLGIIKTLAGPESLQKG